LGPRRARGSEPGLTVAWPVQRLSFPSPARRALDGIKEPKKCFVIHGAGEMGIDAALFASHSGIAGSAAGVPVERRDPVTSSYVRVTGLAGLFAKARELSVRTMIFDVEPLVAPWHGSQESLDQGIARILGDARTVPSVRVVIFATNSARRPSAVPASDGLQVRYLASAGKPLRTAPYHSAIKPYHSAIKQREQGRRRA